jgi:hypothetical protein
MPQGLRLVKSKLKNVNSGAGFSVSVFTFSNTTRAVIGGTNSLSGYTGNASPGDLLGRDLTARDAYVADGLSIRGDDGPAYRGDAWTNPLSSEGSATGGNRLAPTTASPASPNTAPALPDGVRLVLALGPGQTISGTLTRDWMRADLGRSK